MSHILEATGLKKYYGSEPNVTKALNGVDLSIEQGNSFPSLEHQEAENLHCCTCWADWMCQRREVSSSEGRKLPR